MVLRAENLHKTYEDKIVLSNISLELDSGEICALMGTSGSGKTTLLRILAGLISPDSGTVFLHDVAIEGPDRKLVPGNEEIHLVHQDFKLKHRMTVTENIRYELLDYVKEYQLERIEELLSLCNIAHLRDTEIELLSGGEKQRVAIARALASEPEVILMDEPFSNLDLNTKSTLLQEIKDISKTTNTAIILVTHDSRDALEISDKLLVLSGSEIIRQGSPREVYQQPEFAEVAGLFGTYNVLPPDLLEGKSANIAFGLWPEDLRRDPERGLKAQVISQRFMGNYWKVLVRVKGYLLTAYAPTRIEEQSIQLSFHEQDLFPLKMND